MMPSDDEHEESTLPMDGLVIQLGIVCRGCYVLAGRCAVLGAGQNERASSTAYTGLIDNERLMLAAVRLRGQFALYVYPLSVPAQEHQHQLTSKWAKYASSQPTTSPSLILQYEARSYEKLAPVANYCQRI